MGYSPWGGKELDTTEATQHTAQELNNTPCKKLEYASVWDITNSDNKYQIKAILIIPPGQKPL